MIMHFISAGQLISGNASGNTRMVKYNLQKDDDHYDWFTMRRMLRVKML